MKIALLRFSSLGDVALCFPVLEALKYQDDLEIDFYTRQSIAPLPQILFKNIKVIALDFKKYKGIKGIWNLSRQIKSRQYDVIIDWHDILRTKILRFFLQKKTPIFIINKGRCEKKKWIKKKEFQKKLPHSTFRYQQILEIALARKIPLCWPSYSNGSTERIAVAPFAAHPAKEYPFNQIKATLFLLKPHFKEILIFGNGLFQKQQINTCIKELGAPLKSMVDKGWKEEILAMKTCSLCLSMDSANAHIADFLGLKVLTLWGATHPNIGFAAFRQPFSHHLISPLPPFEKRKWSIYGKTKDIDTLNSIAHITPEKIVQKILEMNLNTIPIENT